MSSRLFLSDDINNHNYTEMSLKQRAASGQQGAAPAVASFPQQQMPRVVEDRRGVAGVGG